MSSISQHRALVVGLGRSGRAAALALRRCGAAVIATDEKPQEALRDVIDEIESAGARFVEPGSLNGSLREATVAVVSPGVPPSSSVFERVRAARVPVIGEIELAYELCAAPMIAVTGTKGKSTTSALIAHLLQSAGFEVRLGGNIGTPLVDTVVTAPSRGWVVAEVSSFQLEGIVRFRPRISVLLNIAADHLDRYASLGEYAEAKFRIFRNQQAGDTVVLDLDDPLLAALDDRLARSHPAVTRLWYTVRSPRAARAAVWLEGEDVIYRKDDGAPQVVFTTKDVRLPGEHNLGNAMAAGTAAIAAGCEIASIAPALRSFTPLAHRQQRICEIDDVLYVDDSKATTPSAAIAALRSYDRPVILIAGGRAKGTDFGALGAEIEKRVKLLVAVGEAGPQIAAAAPATQCERAVSIEDALTRARRHACSGDVVLLSPACASFDMFASAEDRGERFSRAVRELVEPARAQ
jgi:UDP-N-acetylmuramoylalanine--D-glutamate ligase